MMIGIVDYGMGNLGSVKRKLQRIGSTAIISASASELGKCHKLILPGVGNFAAAVDEIKKRNLWSFLNEEALLRKKPILGICLGVQLMARHSEEGDCDGFGWIDADVVRFDVSDKLLYKVPHIGWNSVSVKHKNKLDTVIGVEDQFYFVHSYHLKCNDPADVWMTTTYDYEFVSAVCKDNVYGTQFHPEKSQDVGSRLLREFAGS